MRNQYRFMIILQQESMENYTAIQENQSIKLYAIILHIFGEMIAQIPLLKINIHPRTISPLYVLRVSDHFLIRNSNHVVMKPRTISTYVPFFNPQKYVGLLQFVLLLSQNWRLFDKENWLYFGTQSTPNKDGRRTWAGFSSSIKTRSWLEVDRILRKY